MLVRPFCVGVSLIFTTVWTRRTRDDFDEVLLVWPTGKHLGSGSRLSVRHQYSDHQD